MTPNNTQFEALAELMGAQPGQLSALHEAARLVLVQGMRQVDAAKDKGVTQAGLTQCLGRYRRKLDLARKAVLAQDNCNSTIIDYNRAQPTKQ